MQYSTQKIYRTCIHCEQNKDQQENIYKLIKHAEYLSDVSPKNNTKKNMTVINKRQLMICLRIDTKHIFISATSFPYPRTTVLHDNV